MARHDASSLAQETRRRPAQRAVHLISSGSSRANVEMTFAGARGAPALVARFASRGASSRDARPRERAGAARAASRARRVAPRAAQKAPGAETTVERPSSSGDDEAFDDPLATQFKRMYATPGKRIKWGVFKEDVDPLETAAVSESAARAAGKPLPPTAFFFDSRQRKTSSRLVLQRNTTHRAETRAALVVSRYASKHAREL